MTQKSVRRLLQIIHLQGCSYDIQVDKDGIYILSLVRSSFGTLILKQSLRYLYKGCIDGFSRHIIWLEAYSTNKSSWNSKHILWKYAVEFRMEHPKRIIADMGTENGHRKYTKKIKVWGRRWIRSKMFSLTITREYRLGGRI